MKRIFALLSLPALAGCLSPAPMPTVSRWNVEYNGPKVAERAAKYESARPLQIVVRPPYDVLGLTVLKADGTVAFDPYNEFATMPTALFKGAVFDAMVASGLFGTVVNASSAASVSAQVEVMVTKLVLDCRKEGERHAVVDVVVRILDGRKIAATVQGSGSADAANGDFGTAFSSAFSGAMYSAFGQMR